MNTKFATTLVIAAAALGTSSSFAYGTSNDNGTWSPGNGSAVAMNPDGDAAPQGAFQSGESRGQVSSRLAQNRTVPIAVADCPDGPALVEYRDFRSGQTPAAVRQIGTYDHAVIWPVAFHPED
ncbi:MAG: hypothetical protein ABJB17_11465 [Burkholderiales bacterium]